MWLLAFLNEVIGHDGVLFEMFRELPIACIAWFFGCEWCNEFFLIESHYCVAPAFPHCFARGVNLIGLYLVGSFVTCLLALEHLGKVRVDFLCLAL